MSPNKSSDVPYDNLASGIAHGPYSDIPDEMLQHYVDTREFRLVPNTTSDEQLIEDTRSEWQYDQHSAAVEDALEQGRITPLHAMHMLEEVLRPWFIGVRNKGE